MNSKTLTIALCASLLINLGVLGWLIFDRIDAVRRPQVGRYTYTYTVQTRNSTVFDTATGETIEYITGDEHSPPLITKWNPKTNVLRGELPTVDIPDSVRKAIELRQPPNLPPLIPTEKAK